MPNVNAKKENFKVTWNTDEKNEWNWRYFYLLIKKKKKKILLIQAISLLALNIIYSHKMAIW